MEHIAFKLLNPKTFSDSRASHIRYINNLHNYVLQTRMSLFTKMGIHIHKIEHICIYIYIYTYIYIYSAVSNVVTSN